MRYFVRFAYRGTAFHGSQTQPNGITVQETMESAFSIVLRMPVALTFAGRTDAGVHASEMWAHFDYPQRTEDSEVQEVSEGSKGIDVSGGSKVQEVIPENLAFRLNGILPDSIVIYDIVPVREGAHARFDAKQRTYEYHIITHKDAFTHELKTRVRPGLDYTAMNEAAALLLGRHDFASFCRANTDVKTTFCTITRAEWTVGDDDTACFTIAADRFLRNMVRAVVGTLFEVGWHRMTTEQFAAVIEQRNRCAAGQSAPAEGLFLVKVDYPKELFL